MAGCEAGRPVPKNWGEVQLTISEREAPELPELQMPFSASENLEGRAALSATTNHQCRDPNQRISRPEWQKVASHRACNHTPRRPLGGFREDHVHDDSNLGRRTCT